MPIPGTGYPLRSLPGSYSGLQLVSLMYTGLQLIDPSAEAGIDLSREFAEAKARFEEKSNGGKN